MKYSELNHHQTGETVTLDVDLCVINDDISLETVKELQNAAVFDQSKTIIIMDQVVPPNSAERSGVLRELMNLSKEQGIQIVLGQGMTGQIICKGKVKTGYTVVGANPVVATAGAAGAAGICVDEKELVKVFASGKIDVKVPEVVDVDLEGTLPGECSEKDVVLTVLKDLGESQMEGKMIQIQGKTEVFGLDERIAACVLLSRTGALCTVFDSVQTASVKKNIDLTQIVPMAAPGNSYAHIVPVSEMDAQKVKVVFIGGSAGGSFESIKMLADAVRGKKIAYGIRLSVAAASSEIYNKMADAGYVTDILDSGALILNQCADPEIQCRIGANETMVSNDWKNAPGYAGVESSQVIITSTAAAIEAAMTGVIGKTPAVVEEDRKPIVLEGKCWKFGDDIDTDIIIPTQWVCVPYDEMLTHAFEPLRPEMAAQIKPGDIIVAGDNFGCGSSREMAAEVIAGNGIRCVIAKSFARIFFRNAINNGILLIECADLPDEVSENDIVRVEVNNKITCNGKDYPIGKIKENLYEIIADGGLVKNIEKKVKLGLL